MVEYLFYTCLPIVGFLYSSVGHGVASGYWALLTLFTFNGADIKTITLTLNLFVVGIAFYQYFKVGYFDKKLFVLLAVASIPFAYWGGIISSPLLLLLHWSNTKITAGISSLFIFVNSLAGHAGQFSLNYSYPKYMPVIILLVVVGGLLGSYLGLKKLSPIRIKQLLALVLILASVKIFIR